MMQTLSECNLCFECLDLAFHSRGSVCLLLPSHICDNTSSFHSTPIYFLQRFFMKGTPKHCKIKTDYIQPVHWTCFYHKLQVSFMETMLAFVSSHFTPIHKISPWVLVQCINFNNLEIYPLYLERERKGHLSSFMETHSAILFSWTGISNLFHSYCKFKGD